ncbi:MAG: phytanoyl-CoA dioxygenase family protein [Acetobacteraceae bacterium]|nr:phytanoyl-CoA dioxygenase family protein [Acetobacteraceae bacterium]
MDRDRFPGRRRAGRSRNTAKADRMNQPPTAQELATFDRDGFLVLRGFLEPPELADLQRWTAEISAEPEIPGRHMVYYEDSLTEPGRRIVQRIENFCPFHPGFDRLLRRGKLIDWSGALLGGPAVLFKEKINFKLPGGGGFTLHQDQQAGWSAYAPLFLTAMVGIDESTVENGCLEIASGRHKQGLIGEEWRPLEAEGLVLNPVPTQPGDVIFFDSFVPHASGPNQTQSPRRILYVTYALAKHGDHRARYFADKRRDFPPDMEREPGQTYTFRV